MIQLISALLAGAFLLSACTQQAAVSTAIDPKATQRMCVHSYDASVDELSIYFDTAYDFVPEIQHISNVSNSTADQTIVSLGMCSEVLSDDWRTN